MNVSLDNYLIGVDMERSIPDLSNTTTTSNVLNTDKKVLLIGGPKDGDIQRIKEDHCYISCYIQPEIPPFSVTSNNKKKEETLIIDEEGNEKWFTEWEETEYIEPEEFIYSILLVDYDINKRLFVGVPEDLEEQCKQLTHSIQNIFSVCNSEYTKQYIEDNYDVIINIIGEGVVFQESQGIFQQIDNSDYQLYNYDSNFTEEGFNDIIERIFSP